VWQTLSLLSKNKELAKNKYNTTYEKNISQFSPKRLEDKNKGFGHQNKLVG